MRNQLVNYIDLLFAGNPEAADIKEEILQNTLDRYDDMIAQGRTPEAAYSLAISGIGDLSEILNSAAPRTAASAAEPAESPRETKVRRLQRAVAVALYILCPVPVVCIPSPIGLSMLLILVALATALIIISGRDRKKEAENLPRTPQQKLRKSISDLIWTIGTIVYFIVSFTTMAWHITWIIFPLLGAAEGLVNACLDLREEP